LYVSDERDRLGSSGVFKAMVEGARKVKRALTPTHAEEELSPEAQELGEKIGQAFVAGRFADIHAMTTPGFQEHTSRTKFESSWRDATRERGPFTGFEASNVGQIDLGFIPGLEAVPQSQFVAFVEIAFSSPGLALDDKKAFVVGAVLLDHGGAVRIGALHTR